MRVLRRLLLPVVLFLVWAPTAYAWSWPVQGPVLQPFSFDEAHPYAGGQHRGIDIGADAGGAPVVAPDGGVVTFAGTVPSSGKCVTIETPDGYSVTLTHLGSTLVGKGAIVAEGDLVGTIGPSGTPEVDGPYLHLGIRVTADGNGYLDPLTLLPVPAPADAGSSGDLSTVVDDGSGAVASPVPDPFAGGAIDTPPDAGLAPDPTAAPDPFVGAAGDGSTGSAPDPQPAVPPGSTDFAALPDTTDVTVDGASDSGDGTDPAAGDAVTTDSGDGGAAGGAVDTPPDAGLAPDPTAAPAPLVGATGDGTDPAAADAVTTDSGDGGAAVTSSDPAPADPTAGIVDDPGSGDWSPIWEVAADRPADEPVQGGDPTQPVLDQTAGDPPAPSVDSGAGASGDDSTADVAVTDLSASTDPSTVSVDSGSDGVVDPTVQPPDDTSQPVDQSVAPTGDESAGDGSAVDSGSVDSVDPIVQPPDDSTQPVASGGDDPTGGDPAGQPVASTGNDAPVDTNPADPAAPADSGEDWVPIAVVKAPIPAAPPATHPVEARPASAPRRAPVPTPDRRTPHSPAHIRGASTAVASTPVISTGPAERPIDVAPGRKGGPPAPPPLAGETTPHAAPRPATPVRRSDASRSDASGRGGRRVATSTGRSAATRGEPARTGTNDLRADLPPQRLVTHAVAGPARTLPSPRFLQLALAAGPGVLAAAAAIATALSRLRRRLADTPVLGGAVVHLPRRAPGIRPRDSGRRAA